MYVAELGMTIPVGVIPEDAIGFKIMRNGEPVEGANVILCTKGVIPVTYERITDSSGSVIWYIEELVPDIGEALFEKIPWLLFANIPESDYGFWKDNLNFELGELYTYKLKRYTKVPTFFIKIELKETIGTELFSNLIAEIQTTALEWAGLEVVGVKGVGTRHITIQFKPPFHESPIVIIWTAVWFILGVLAVAGAIIAILVIWKWTFGELAGVAGVGAIILLLIAAAVVAKPTAKYIKERQRREEE